MVRVPLQIGRESPFTDCFPEAFRNSLQYPPSLDPNLEEALRHVLEHPGSLIRPRLVARIGTVYGLELGQAQNLAIALEYFHSASLLFDDLPCMDNALERRGVPCAHLMFGEAGAILAALALINRAYALTWRAVSHCDPKKQAPALVFVEDCLGVNGLLNGQSLDLNYRALPHTRETTELVARGKTVSLIRLTMVLPAMLGNAGTRELRLLERIALFWGLAYQALDDLKDLLQSVSETGKTAARDVLLDRPNTAAVVGLDPAIGRVGKLIQAGNSALRRLMIRRAGLDFLESLRDKLEQELERLSHGTFGAGAGGHS